MKKKNNEENLSLQDKRAIYVLKIFTVIFLYILPCIIICVFTNITTQIKTLICIALVILFWPIVLSIFSLPCWILFGKSLWYYANKFTDYMFDYEED